VKQGVLLAAIVAVVIGCQQAPPPPPAPTKSPAIVLREEGDALAARGDYAGAVAKYETALASTPDDLALRFALGSAYSYLKRQPEAVVQFKHVVARATPDSQESQLARQWLVSVGELREAQAGPARTPTASESRQTPTTAQGPQVGLSGTLEWRGIAQGRRRVPVRLTLIGEDSENRNVNSARMARLAEKYSFANIPPGNYRLVVVGTEPRETLLWEVRVNVERDKPTVLNLNSSTASVSPDAFPGPE
jgi:hypothetical protein